MPASPKRRRDRARPLSVGAIVVAGSVLVASVALAAPSKTVVVSDPRGDVGGPLDVTRASLQRASDGRLRAVVTFAGKITAKTMLATSGPPGSVCLRIWTATDADPKAMRPDRLACITARAADDLRAGVYEVTGPALPRRVARASVKRNSSGRSVVIRFSQSSLGRPRRIRFAVESTRPGCERPSCIDSLPDRGGVRTFRPR